MLAPAQIIREKRDGRTLSTQDLQDFFTSYLAGETTDYQVSAMLMAMFCQGMSKEETAALTIIMRDSGRVLEWSTDGAPIVDKHSTGGVGDKTSMILLPLVALAGMKVPMISGRGLGHTGGTLDKLESIPGMQVRLDEDTSRHIVNQHGGAFMGQTEDIAPLDKRLYALRDVTATVESIPLITGSILSKKAAAGIGSLVLDVKFGSGAFMANKEDARALANSLQEVGTQIGMRTRCLLTNMNSPLGSAAGNSLEIEECVAVLQGGGPADTRDLSIELAAQMVQLADPQRDYEETKRSFAQALDDGTAFERFCSIIAAQGGDTSVFSTSGGSFPEAKIIQPVLAEKAGSIKHIDTRKLGLSVVALGGGRLRSSDKVDHSVGLTDLPQIGRTYEVGQPLCTIHGQSNKAVEEAAALILDSVSFSSEPCSYQLIEEII